MYHRYPYRFWQYCILKVSPILVPLLKKYRRYYWYQYQYCNINNFLFNLAYVLELTSYVTGNLGWNERTSLKLPLN